MTRVDSTRFGLGAELTKKCTLISKNINDSNDTTLDTNKIRLDHVFFKDTTCPTHNTCTLLDSILSVGKVKDHENS